VLHDAHVDRTTDGVGAVRDLAWADVRRLDAGWRFTAPDGSHPYRGRGIGIPSLADLLEAFPGVPLNIEVKQGTPPIVARVLATLDAYDARARTLLAAEHHDVMETIRVAATDVATSFSAAEVADFINRFAEGRWEEYRPAGVALQVPPSFGDVTIVSAETVGAAHDLGLEVHVWTINEPNEMRALLALGVDAIMTDVPRVARSVIEAARSRAGG